MRKQTLVFTILYLCIPVSAVSAESNVEDKILSSIIPQPRGVRLTGADFMLTKNTRILYSGRGQELEDFAVSSFSEFLNETHNLLLKTEASGKAQSAPDTILIGNASAESFLKEALKAEGFEPSPKIGDEGYQLLVKANRIIVHAKTAAGQFYGLQTLKQLIYESRDGLAVRGAAITDYPRYRLRGFQLDAGRCPQSIPMMKRMIRICSAFKLNFVMFREGDDELNAIRYKTNKLGSMNPRVIGIDEMARFVRYAAKHHIKVIPEIESLGHSGAKAFLYPDLVHKGGRRTKYEGIGIHLRKRRLVLENPQTYDLLRSIYSEWVPIIASPYMHLGCDEAGRGTGEHLAKLTAMLNELGKKHGKRIRPIVWADAASTPDNLKQQVVRCLWAYGETGGKNIDESNKFLNRTGQNVKTLIEPGCREEVIMAGGSDSYHTPLAKAKYENAVANIHSWCQFGRDRTNFIGIFAVQWSGNQQDRWLPDNLTVAEYGWTPDKPAFDYANCMMRIKTALAGIKDYANPRPCEVDRSCWDGIWLDENNKWGKDIMGLAIPISEK